MVDLLAFGNSRFELIAEYNAAGTMLKRYVLRWLSCYFLLYNFKKIASMA